jgi:hypothetical protein
MKIYTRTGDLGETGLFGGPRLGKDTARIETYGTVDELNAVLGLVRAEPLSAELVELLARVPDRTVRGGGRAGHGRPGGQENADHRSAARRGPGGGDRPPRANAPTAAELYPSGRRPGVRSAAPGEDRLSPGRTAVGKACSLQPGTDLVGAVKLLEPAGRPALRARPSRQPPGRRHGCSLAERPHQITDLIATSGRLSWRSVPI